MVNDLETKHENEKKTSPSLSRPLAHNRHTLVVRNRKSDVLIHVETREFKFINRVNKVKEHIKIYTYEKNLICLYF